MTYDIETVDQYIKEIPAARAVVIEKLRSILLKNLPEGFEETILYKMPSYVIPHSIYPDGYHCNPKDPLPFISIASQKNFIAFYHMGIYANTELLEWFQLKYIDLEIGKLDMGKSCIRFKNLKKIPYDLLEELVKKITVEEWIGLYEYSKKKT
ncbi:MAG: DUF1801 domain-containing protein [Spirochaetaceae bacterium]